MPEGVEAVTLYNSSSWASAGSATAANVIITSGAAFNFLYPEKRSGRKSKYPFVDIFL